jgi:hypothetical protein
MKNTLLAFLILFGFITKTAAQSLYTPNVLQEIKITFYQANWDFLLDSLKNLNNGGFLMAPSVEINGQLFDSVGIKYKGNSSYSTNNGKNPMHIELDYLLPNQNYQGIKDLKLSNSFADPTFIREPLSYEILRQYTDAPLANHAKLWINGVYWGLYGNVESINKRFVRNHFKTDGNNPFFKCNPADFDGPGTGGNYADLVYSSADSSFYYNKYDIQSDHGWQELLFLMDTLNNHPNHVRTLLDVDRAIWMLAFNVLLVNLDSYSGAYGQNYYLYRDRNNRWLPISWDLNMSFGGFPLLNIGSGGALSVAQMKQLDPLIQSGNSNRPLIKQLLANPTYKRMYLAHMRTMLQENFLNGSYKNKALELQSVIDAAVQADTKKFFSYTSFLNNINQSVTGGFGTVPGLVDLMDARSAFLQSNSNFTAIPPSIANIQATLGSVVEVTATIQNALTVLLAWRTDSADVFQKNTMFDDGQHADGAANDGVYGGAFPQDDARMQYYIYAENANAGVFSPERAEHEFYIANPFIPNAGDVVINEFLADNAVGAVDEAGEPEDWLELYNNTISPITLTGLYLSDDPTDRNKWAFPAGVSIPGKGYLMVWLDDDASQGPFHANFKLNAAGEHIMLSDGGSNVIDALSFGAQQPDISYGRYPNGTGSFTTMPTTFNAINSLTINTLEQHAENLIQVFPNPVADVLTIQSKEALQEIRILNMLGQLVALVPPSGNTAVRVPVHTLNNGLYILEIAGQKVRIAVQH